MDVKYTISVCLFLITVTTEPKNIDFCLESDKNMKVQRWRAFGQS